MPTAKKQQSLANHTRFDPAFHFFVGPIFLLNVIATIAREIRGHSLWHLWSIVVAVGALVAVTLIRTYALKVQDRVIVLEERLRLGSLAEGLTERQLIALRFAADSEAPSLAGKAQIEKLGPKQIKQQIRSWKPDYWRV